MPMKNCFRLPLLFCGMGMAMVFGTGVRLLRAQTQPRLADKQTALRFTNPTAITNGYLPLAHLHQDILEGKEDGKSVRVERAMKPGTRAFLIDGQKVEARIMEDREFIGGKLKEVTLDYFAQAEDGSVCYLGEKVDMYRDGKVIGHEGAWLVGEHSAKPGVIMPAHPKVGDKFRSEICASHLLSLEKYVPSDFRQDILRFRRIWGQKWRQDYSMSNVITVREETILSETEQALRLFASGGERIPGVN